MKHIYCNNKNDNWIIPAPILINTDMQNVDGLWNSDGTILSICGMKADTNAKESNQVIFYSPFGKHLRTLKIPGREITSLSWEGQSLRIALTVDSFIYFANIRPDYVWCYFEKTVVFFSDINTNMITFWNTTSNQVYDNLKVLYKIISDYLFVFRVS